MIMKKKGAFLMLAILVTLLYSETSARPVSKLKNKQIRRTLVHKQNFVDECSIEGYLNTTPFISTDCEEGLRSALLSEFEYNEALRTGCGIPNCIAPFLDYLLNQSCADEAYIEYIALQCGYDYYNGKSCYSQLLDISTLDSFFSESCLSALFDPDTCTYECTDALAKVDNLLGCCINNLFNNTYFRSYPSVTTYALSYEVWSQCGVATQGFCPVDYYLERFLLPETQQGYMMSFGSFSFPGFDTTIPDLPSNGPVIQPPTNPFGTNDGNFGDIDIPSFPIQFFPQLQQFLDKNGFKLPDVKEPVSKPDLNNVWPTLDKFSDVRSFFPQHKRKTKLQQWGTNDFNFPAKEIQIPNIPADPWRTLVGELFPSKGKKVAKNQKNEKEKRKLNEKLLDLLSRSLEEK